MVSAEESGRKVPRGGGANHIPAPLKIISEVCVCVYMYVCVYLEKENDRVHTAELHGKQMGKQWEECQDFILGGSKITADGDCSHETERCLLLGRKVMSNLDSILKSRDITLSTKVHLGKVMVFPVVMYGYESWTIKKAERRRIDASELWC